MILAKILGSIIVTAVMFIPLWFWLILSYLITPVGFWQQFVMMSAGLFFLGVIQLLFLIAGIVVIVVMLTRS